MQNSSSKSHIRDQIVSAKKNYGRNGVKDVLKQVIVLEQATDESFCYCKTNSKEKIFYLGLALTTVGAVLILTSIVFFIYHKLFSTAVRNTNDT